MANDSKPVGLENCADAPDVFVNLAGIIEGVWSECLTPTPILLISSQRDLAPGVQQLGVRSANPVNTYIAGYVGRLRNAGTVP